MARMTRVGVGTYRLLWGTAAHRASLEHALRHSGFGVVDTSPNYNEGLSEQLVGQVIGGLEAGIREEVRVMTKFGFIQGPDLEEHRKRPVPGAVEYTDSCMYSIDPEFMRKQLGQSLARLGVATIDTYLVHNPEHLLINSVPPESTADGAQAREARTRLKARLERAFLALEEQVAAGKISSYGVSSNSFALPRDHPHFVPFEWLPELSAKAAKDVHGETTSRGNLTTFQLPGNVLERVGLTPEPLGGNGCAQFAKKRGIDVVVNRALTAFDEAGSWRLAESEFPVEFAKSRDELVQHLTPEKVDEATLSEDEQKEWKETLEACSWLKRLIMDLEAQINSFSSVMHYQDDLMRTIIPMINSKLEGIDDETSALLFKFFAEYEKAVRSVAGQQTRSHVFDALSKDEFLKGADGVPDFVRPRPPLTVSEPAQSLQEYSLSWLRDHPCVDTVLLGCTRTEYADMAARVFFDTEVVKN